MTVILKPEGAIVWHYIFRFIILIIMLLTMGVLLIVKRRIKLPFREPFISPDTLERHEKKEKKFIIIVRIVFVALLLYFIFSILLPLGLDISHAISKDYLETAAVVLDDEKKDTFPSRWGRSIKVRAVDDTEEFYIEILDLPIDLKKGQVIYIQVLPHSKVGGFSIMEESDE